MPNFLDFCLNNQWEVCTYLKKKIQGQNVKNLSFFWKIEHFTSLIHCEKIESLNKNLFYIYFFLSKKYFKKVFTSTHRWNYFFFVSYWNLVLFNVFDFKVLQTHLKCLKWTVSRDFWTLLFCLKDSTWAWRY